MTRRSPGHEGLQDPVDTRSTPAGSAAATLRARAASARALELLDHESPERLRRFGGGFDRDDLRRLCRDEMQETRA